MNKTVVISCAGKGSRLGLNIPKCLVNINGKSLLERNIELLTDVNEIIIVVGFKGEEVTKKVKELSEKYKKDIKIVWNENYENTATGASFSLGASLAQNDFIIALDGDMLVHPSDMQMILNEEEEFVCGEIPHTEEPVYIQLNEENQAIGFSKVGGGITYEWSGIAGIYKNHIKPNKWYVCDIMAELLPLKAIKIRAKEIDTKKDLEGAKKWVSENIDAKKLIDKFFQERINIENNYIASRYHQNNRDEFDFNLIKNYINENSSVLDLGCGTGILEEKLSPEVKSIVGVDKFQGFLTRAYQANNIKYIVADLANLDTSLLESSFNLILLFGVSFYLSDEELEDLISKVVKLMKQDSIFIIKNQWGIDKELIVNKYSEDLQSYYYAKYRKLKDICTLIDSFNLSCEVIDIYPSEMNLWSNTHEYALIVTKKSEVKNEN